MITHEKNWFIILMPMSHHPSWHFEINSLKLIVSIFYPLFLYGLLDNFMTWIIKRSLTKLEKIYLQGKPAGQRRADEAASAQYLRWFWQGFFVKMLTSTQNCAEIWSWPMPSSRNPMTQWLLIPNYSNQFIFWWNLWKRFLNRIFLP